MPARKLPDNDVLLAWLNQGKTHAEIAQLVEQTTGQKISPSTVSVAVSRLGAADRRASHLEYIPWKVKAEHIRQYPALMLRFYARYMQANKDASVLRPDDRRRLFGWLAMLQEENKVVDYKPDEGFVLVKRRATDDTENVIRRPKPNSPLLRTGTSKY